jgi:hypothetical protein
MVDGTCDQDFRSDPRRATYARRASSIASRASVAAARNCVITASANASDELDQTAQLGELDRQPIERICIDPHESFCDRP